MTFAGYKIPHPLEYQLLIKVRTDGSQAPPVVVSDALEKLTQEVNGLLQEFNQEAQRIIAQGPR